MVRKLLALVAIALGVALPAAAGTSPSQLLQRATAAATSATSVRVIATGIPDGKSSISFDFRIVTGKGGAGSMMLGTDKIDLIRVGKFAYFRASGPFWRKFGGATTEQLLAGRWVKMSSSNPDFKSLIELTDTAQFFTGILSGHGKVKAGSTKTINGIKSVGIIDTSNGGGTLWVAANGTPYPVAIVPPSGPGAVYFTSWNQPMHVAAPSKSIDFSKLKK